MAAIALVEAWLASDNNLVNFTFNNPVGVQFLRFDLLSYIGDKGGLQYLAPISAIQGEETTQCRIFSLKGCPNVIFFQHCSKCFSPLSLRFEHLVDFFCLTRARSARPQGPARAVTGRQCPQRGKGEDFLTGQPDFFTETAVTPERKVEKSFPRWEINRHGER